MILYMIFTFTFTFTFTYQASEASSAPFAWETTRQQRQRRCGDAANYRQACKKIKIEECYRMKLANFYTVAFLDFLFFSFSGRENYQSAKNGPFSPFFAIFSCLGINYI